MKPRLQTDGTSWFTPSDIREWIAAKRSSLKVFNYVFVPIENQK